MGSGAAMDTEEVGLQAVDMGYIDVEEGNSGCRCTGKAVDTTGRTFGAMGGEGSGKRGGCEIITVITASDFLYWDRRHEVDGRQAKSELSCHDGFNRLVCKAQACCGCAWPAAITGALIFDTKLDSFDVDQVWKSHSEKLNPRPNTL